jgi:peptidoglycan/xylan/chitin deacetylase (PgdA/CDA1 family)
VTARIPGWKVLRQSARWLRSRGRPRVVILGYHRVADAPIDPFRMAISPAAFEAQLAFLANRCRPVSLTRAIEQLGTGRVPARTVVVTLDDGYEDTLQVALPLLRRHAVPATVFVCTGSAGRAFWWDRLAAVVGYGARLPARFTIDVGTTRHELATSDHEALLGRLSRMLEPAHPDEREHLLAALQAQAPSGAAPAARALLPDELAELAGDPLVEVGGHTVNHAPLAVLAEDDQRREIAENRRVIESVTGRPVSHFAYPHGSHSMTTTRLVRDAGYEAACCSTPDVALPGSDRLTLPRLWVDSRAGFERWITRWLG